MYGDCCSGTCGTTWVVLVTIHRSLSVRRSSTLALLSSEAMTMGRPSTSQTGSAAAICSVARDRSRSPRQHPRPSCNFHFYSHNGSVKLTARGGQSTCAYGFEHRAAEFAGSAPLCADEPMRGSPNKAARPSCNSSLYPRSAAIKLTARSQPPLERAVSREAGTFLSAAQHREESDGPDTTGPDLQPSNFFRERGAQVKTALVAPVDGQPPLPKCHHNEDRAAGGGGPGRLFPASRSNGNFNSLGGAVKLTGRAVPTAHFRGPGLGTRSPDATVPVLQAFDVNNFYGAEVVSQGLYGGGTSSSAQPVHEAPLAPVAPCPDHFTSRLSAQAGCEMAWPGNAATNFSPGAFPLPQRCAGTGCACPDHEGSGPPSWQHELDRRTDAAHALSSLPGAFVGRGGFASSVVATMSTAALIARQASEYRSYALDGSGPAAAEWQMCDFSREIDRPCLESAADCTPARLSRQYSATDSRAALVCQSRQVLLEP